MSYIATLNLKEDMVLEKSLTGINGGLLLIVEVISSRMQGKTCQVKTASILPYKGSIKS